MSLPVQSLPDAPAGRDGQHPGGRLLWVDVAKGACILLVVLHHAVVKDLAVQAPASLAPVVDAWVAVSMALKPVRMPLFFLLSGFVASSAVRRPWAQARRRVLSPYYLYVVWLVLQGAFFSVERRLPMNRTQDLGELFGDLVWASTNLWFLYALTVYFVLARLLAGLPRAWVLGAAAVVSAAAGLLPTDDWNRVSVVAHFLFFAVGALAPDLVRRLSLLAARAPGRLGVLYLGVVVPLSVLGTPQTVETLVASTVGVPLGIGACVLVARTRWAGGLAWIGRRTLPVYVLHAPLLALALYLPTPLAPDRTGVIEALLYPVLLTVVAVATALGLHAVLRWAGAVSLFELPRRPQVRTPRPARAQAAASAQSRAQARAESQATVSASS